MTENNFYELPKNWLWARLNDVGVIASGGTPSTKDADNFDGEIPWITPADLSGFSGKYINRGKRNISEKGLRSSSAVLLPSGSVIFSSRAPIGYAAIAANRLSTNQGFKNLIPHEGIFKDYVFHYLKGNKRLAEKFASGTTFLEVSGSRFAQIPIPIPPLSEQHRIVAKIEELFSDLDAGVEALKKAKAQLKLYRQAVLKAAFEGRLTTAWREANEGELEPANVLLERIKKQIKDIEINKGKDLQQIDESVLSELPERWAWTRIGEISDKIHYGYTESSTIEKIGPKFLRITDIQDNSVNWDLVPHCPIKDNEKHKYLLREGDLVFARTGATVGKSYLISGNIPEAVFASYLIRIILNALINKNYVYYYFQSLSYWEQIHEKKLGIGQPNVNGQILAQIIMPLPPIPEQEKITQEIERCFSLADAVDKALNDGLIQSDRLRQSILKKAFAGELVPQDPEDEPAAELLERIKKEKAGYPAGKKSGRRAAQRNLNYG
jgi:type I restriction enzyme, S subunit